MSTKKQSPRSKLQQRPPILPLTIGVVFVVAVIVVLVAASKQGSSTPPEVSGAPRARLDQTQIDLGKVPLDQQVESVFHLRNVGDHPLVILDEPRVELVQGCCPPRAIVSSTTIQPGEEATIALRFTMHEGMGGQHEFRIHVRTNDPSQPEIPLTVLSVWGE